MMLEREKRQTASNLTSNESQKKDNAKKEMDETKRFFDRLDKLRMYSGFDKKMLQYECHCCKRYYVKNIIFTCDICKIKTCYFCI